MKGKIELLAPAANLAGVYGAVAAGADAVYCGGGKFGARAYADNLTEDELLTAIDYVHLHGKKLYLTVNTLVKEDEMAEAVELVRPLYRQGLDGVIIQDVGLFSLFRRVFPGLPLHASTQMTVTDACGVRLLTEMGARRVVLARELSLEEIRKIYKETGAELEIFIHGALCYCYSGQCLFSSLNGGRSGNRGRCAQPCRMEYAVSSRDPGGEWNGADEKHVLSRKKGPAYYLSPRDLNTLEILPEILGSGVRSLKIEGRMKSPVYAAAAVSVYRKYIDLYRQSPEHWHVDPADIRMLLQVFNRGGTTDGYFYRHNGGDMIGIEKPNHYGIPAGTVRMTAAGKGRRASAHMAFSVDIAAQDLLEGRDARQRSVFQITAGRQWDGNSFSYVLTEEEQKTWESLGRPRQLALYRLRHEPMRSSFEKMAVPAQIPVNGHLELTAGRPARLTVEAGGQQVTLYSAESLSVAQNQPADQARVLERMKKTGRLPVVWDTLTCHINGDVFVPAQVLNRLKRQGAEAITAAVAERYRRTGTAAGTVDENMSMPRITMPTERRRCRHGGREPGLAVWVTTREQLKAAVYAQMADTIYIPHYLWAESRDIRRREGIRHPAYYYAFPPVRRGNGAFPAEEAGGAVLNSLDEIQYMRENHVPANIVLNHSLYGWNGEAAGWYRKCLEDASAPDGSGAEKKRSVFRLTAPVELSLKELRAVRPGQWQEIQVYGRYPVMISAGCVRRTACGCEKAGDSPAPADSDAGSPAGILFLADSQGKRYPVQNVCDGCYNIIYHHEPVWLLDSWEELRGMGFETARFHFTVESAGEVRALFKQWRDMLDGHFVKRPVCAGRGHFTDGVL